MIFVGRKFFLAIFLGSICAVNAKFVIHESDDLKVALSGKIGHSTDFQNNAYLLNETAIGARGGKVDRGFLNRSKFEATINGVHGHGVEAQASVRSKFSWGTSKFSTASSYIKYGEALLGSHSHELERNHIYMQEVWMTLGLDQLFNSNLWDQKLTMGLFPFSLGKGISLGDAYAVDPAFLGFYSDSSVDQYAPGIKFSGNLYWDCLGYDTYWSVMKNNTAKLKQTGAQIYDQIIIDGNYVANNQFARGSGDLDWRIASRLRWTALENKEEQKKVYFEPYAMFSRDPSQNLEFTADASSKLGTVGLAGEFEFRGIEFGFDTAFNCGHQTVFAWDRNKVTTKTDSTTGAIIQVYSHVYDDAALTTKTVYTGDTTSYRPDSNISSALNGQAIGATGKFSGSNRFRDKYKVPYKGFMVVADAAMYVYKKDLKIAAAGGFSRGDTPPNSRTGDRATSNRPYRGFVSQQELFYGDRVKSVFAMGSLARPHPIEGSLSYGIGTEGFANIIFAGMGATFAPQDWKRKFEIRPNILVFWQDIRSKKYNSIEDASNRLGTEINTIAAFKIVENLKLTAQAALFLPGRHYTDLKGTPLSAEVAALVEQAEAGVTESLPTLGDSVAFTMSVGMEYSF